MSAYILICEHPCIDLSSEARINVIMFACEHCSLQVLSMLRPPHKQHTWMALSSAHKFVKRVLICAMENLCMCIITFEQYHYMYYIDLFMKWLHTENNAMSTY